MNDREQMKIDVVSGMDDEIVERNTKKRSELEDRLGHKRFRRAWIPILAGAACFFFLFATVLLLFPDKKQVPIYQGMTVSNTQALYEVQEENGGGAAQLARLTGPRDFLVAPVLSISPDMAFLANAMNIGNNGNHYGQHKQTETETETEVPSTLTDFSAERYYAAPGQDIYITIHFSNPDNFEILSFTLNGKKFSNYMFEAGSDMEHLVLKQNVGDVCGLVEFTIDAIKYVDGTEIKDVQMDGDRTVEVGVYEDALPRLAVDKVATDFFTVGCELNLTEHTPTLLRLSEGKVRAALYWEEARVAEQAVSLEEWGKTISVSFGELLSGMDYRVTLEALFDARDGKGEMTHVLWEKTVHTKEALSVTATEVTQDAATFTIEWAEEYPQKEFVGVLLLPSDGAEALPIDPDTLTVRNDPEDSARTIYELTVEGLLSGYEYTLAVSYPNRDVVSVVTDKILTEAKTAPTYVVDRIETTQGTISFDITETDPDSIGTVTKIELLKDGAVAATAADIGQRSFEGLLADNTYTVRVTYTYDLNDGAGIMTANSQKYVMTKAKTAPIYAVDGIETTQGSISFDVIETDPDSIGTLTRIELLDKDGTVVKTAPNVEMRTFDGLFSDHEYTLRVTFAYDLNDGAGEQTASSQAKARTKAKTAPIYAVDGIETTQGSISFDVIETDPDSIGTLTKIELLKDGEVVATAADSEQRSFEGLESASLYTVRCHYQYDLNDGRGAQTKYVEIQGVTRATPIVIRSLQLIEGDGVIDRGASVELRIVLDNPDLVKLNRIKINGVNVNLRKVNEAYYLATYATESSGGREVLACEEVSYTCHGVEFTEELSYTSDVSLIVKGEILLESVTLSEGGEYHPGDEILATLSFKGSEGYVLKRLGLYDLTRVNETTYTISLPFDVSKDSELFYVDMGLAAYCFDLSYSSEVIAQTGAGEIAVNLRHGERVWSGYVCLGEQYSQVIDISTAAQLQSMECGKAYRLVAHIDLSGFDWQPYDFYGVLYGNGYEIRNLTLSGGAMFNILEGYMKDIVLKNALVENSDELFMKESDCLLLDGCRIEGDLISFGNWVSVFTGPQCHGPVILKSCTFDGTISVAGNPFEDPIYTPWGFDMDLENCTFNGTFYINGEEYTP